nr:hypothetical protein [Tanacetum cinerariifolium]
MQEAEEAFQQMKKLITEFPSLTPPREKETLYAYLAVSAEAVSAVLLTDRKGRQCPVQYMNRTLNEAERNYAHMEKLTLSLIHMTRRLMRYFEAHPVKVITDQQIKNILSNTETSGKLAKYAVELGAYNITFIPRNAVKGQVLKDFLSEAPEGTKEDLYFRMPEATAEKDEKADVLSKLASMAFNHLTKEANYVIREIHMGSCSMHVGPRAVVRKAIRQGYYWPTMHEDAKREVKCNICQVHAPVSRLQKTLMTPIMAPWSFNQWGMDILRPLPPARGGAKFVIMSIDYFTKWIEAKPLVKITCKEVICFAMDNIICRFGLPRVIVTDNGAQLANRLVERANRSLMEGIKTRLGREKAGWVDELPNVLWAHRTSIKQSNGETPFSLTYGKQYYNKKVCPAGFRQGDFMFRRNKASRVEDQGKLGPKWEGPYRVVEAYENGSYKLQTLEDKEIPRTWHAINLRKCYM